MKFEKNINNTRDIFWTKKETAGALKVSVKTVTRYIQKGEIPAVKIGTVTRIPVAMLCSVLGRPVDYNNHCAGSIVQGVHTCRSLRGKTARTTRRISPGQAGRELDVLLGQTTARKQQR